MDYGLRLWEDYEHPHCFGKIYQIRINKMRIHHVSGVKSHQQATGLAVLIPGHWRRLMGN